MLTGYSPNISYRYTGLLGSPLCSNISTREREREREKATKQHVSVE
jgi:hypothetical protein